MKSRSTRAGMTMLEVLVGLAIFALAAVGFSAAYVNALKGVHAAAEISRDAGDWRAVRAIVLREPRREIVEQGGELVLPDDQRVAWTVSVRPGEVMDLFEVELMGQVAQGSSPARPHHEVFWVLRPTWSNAADRDRRLDIVKKRPHGGTPT